MFFDISVRVFRFEVMQRLISRTAERHTHTQIKREICQLFVAPQRWANVSVLSHIKWEQPAKSGNGSRSDKININFARAAVCCCYYECVPLCLQVCVCVCALCVPVCYYKIRWLSSAFQWGRCGAQSGDVLLHRIPKRLPVVGLSFLLRLLADPHCLSLSLSLLPGNCVTSLVWPNRTACASTAAFQSVTKTHR